MILTILDRRFGRKKIDAWLNQSGLFAVYNKVGMVKDQYKSSRNNFGNDREARDETIWLWLLSQQGVRGAKTVWFLLAKRVPLLELISFPENKRENILKGVANFSEEEMNLPYWLRDRRLPKTRIWYRGVGPDRFPENRIKHLLEILKRAGTEGIYSYFRSVVDRYYAYSPKRIIVELANRLTMPGLCGDTLAHNLLSRAVIPVLMFFSEPSEYHKLLNVLLETPVSCPEITKSVFNPQYPLQVYGAENLFTNCILCNEDPSCGCKETCPFRDCRDRREFRKELEEIYK